MRKLKYIKSISYSYKYTSIIFFIMHICVNFILQKQIFIFFTDLTVFFSYHVHSTFVENVVEGFPMINTELQLDKNAIESFLLGNSIYHV